MSGFSPELIDYLEGKISFEEFERRREERKSREKDGENASAEENSEDIDAPSSSRKASGKSHSQDETEGETADGVSKSVHRVFASMIGENEEEDDDEEEEEEEEEEETPEQPTAGDVFVLEMVLNRETKKMMKERRPRSKLPRALRGLMGEANIRFARGEREEAILMCMEIIRQAPLAHEPFSTLAMIYEDQGDMEKSLQFELIAAHLNPSDTEEWVRLAEMSLEQDNIKQAVFCYTKALKYDPTNVRYLWERSSLYEQLGEHKNAMDGYRRILNLLSPSDGERFMQLARDMAKSYYEANDVTSAIEIIEEAFTKHQSLVSMEDVNIAAELYISSKQYDKALAVITDFAGIVLQKKVSEKCPTEEKKEDTASVVETQESQEEAVTDSQSHPVAESSTAAVEKVSCCIPEGVPIDITVKLMVCLVHLNILEPLNPLLTTLVEQNPEEMGDLYLDVAEAFLDVGEYNSALPLLSALVCSERYNLAVVWLRHAECLKALGHMERAAESYAKVVDLAPLHLDARISLSTLQQQLGRPEKALEALEPMYDPDTLAQDANAAQQELKLLLHRSTLLYSQGKMYGYIDTLLTMLAMLLKVAMSRAQVCLISSSKSGERHLYLIKVSRDKISDNDDQEAANCDAKAIFAVLTSVLTKDDWWNLLLKAIYSLCDLSRYKEAELLVDSSLEYYSFYDDRQKRKELEYFGLSAAILDKNFRKAYNYIRIMVMENVNKPQLWNIFNQVTMQSQDVRHHRFCLRLMLKNPDNHALCVLNGHNAFVSGSFKHALGQYVQAFRAKPDEPLYSLCIGLTFIHMASQKYVLKRHALLVQGFSFLFRYLDLRGPCQESFYNLGRSLHQLGLLHLAIHYYQKVLELPPPTLEGIETDQTDLRRDTAFNLSLIYQSSGNTRMAQKMLYTYAVV
ncbi:general transcription factor 3C polypeptide 3 isoform X1 [Anas platyrhynchos]|uniref:general transcription factor 3C polypeptide 3 isoform X1 n=1 Tax=Anas platyrhynchos TaxID=8839 RepID=UPI000F7C6E69|nr:general transcription factor 3C polypeptide 3 isoform X1 [Anas platyrhynchos]XP_027317609.1 general transcription factor 3C polypeptide 3 isoform X1 [Anas platyrhynchos]|eukprot:XP_027317608.1 general transcription factor 3C polypeptide 3 isoform X1 [Anas platyrhynchos]